MTMITVKKYIFNKDEKYLFMKSELANFPNILNCFQLVYAIDVFVGQKHTLLSF